MNKTPDVVAAVPSTAVPTVAEPPAVPVPEQAAPTPKDVLRKALRDENAGRGGCYILDPATGVRALKHQTPQPKA
ncbi:hypothetical protein FOZ76_14490 [Verticiella sediminum]|uniref:Uncharacterized protein n=1 Tax=Verticiella sediminum TaxID=1247510 RepID=A0A556AIB3_9BURK|nr:hypothetical protein [Verticiella sediminum]TSH92627.1 hypothetical protein FOZ76_14490 [Verticiella sediminum]